ncbi:hypothetical protein ACJIZ3_023003 [Penstemon smallii]|uniref:DUF547 domain-containing protein n=1 Tax=Penstemon smallii TaxID=265156 RepID=A0ABD3TMU4_9LAMI
MRTQSEDQKQTKKKLKKEVKKLKQDLDEDMQVKRVLQCAMQGPVGCCESCSCLSTILPFKVQMLLTELSEVEEEINLLEKKINELKLDVYQEQKQIKECESLNLKGLQPQLEPRQLKKLPSRRPNQTDQNNPETLSTSQNYEYGKYRVRRERRASSGSSFELHSAIYPEKNGIDEESGSSRSSKSLVVNNRQDLESEIAYPNNISIELIKCLVGIFLNLNQTTYKGPTDLSRQNCINSKGFASKGTFSCRMPIFPINPCASHLDPYEIMPEIDAIRDIGPYKKFIQITTSSWDSNRLSEYHPAMRRLRVLMEKLSRINISKFSHKQKLAFWINIYNACLMHAFLQHGLPSTQENLLALMNEAAINIGGVVLDAFTIEHCILRHPAEVKNELTDEKEVLLRQTYGLDYPEPNVTFALCRGSWSSPALRIYSPNEVIQELEKAKVEYLEASVGITSKKKILVPKLMHWHMKDFADDMGSLLEWIYSQLPYTSSLKRLIMECLNRETHCPGKKLIKFQPYASEFRYLLPL